MLGRVVGRLRRARTVHEVLVATTTETADDSVSEYCGSHHIQAMRGSEFDVLDRYYMAARGSRADVIVRITADCPVVDPVLVDDVLEALMTRRGWPDGAAAAIGVTKLDFAANRLPPPWRRTYPIGLDTEACTFQSLEVAWHDAREPHQREHVMPYLYEGARLTAIAPGISAGVTSRGFQVALLDCETDLGDFRWTVDTTEDLEFVRRIYAHFGGRDDFSWRDVLELVRDQPDLMKINAGIRHKTLTESDERAPDLDGL